MNNLMSAFLKGLLLTFTIILIVILATWAFMSTLGAVVFLVASILTLSTLAFYVITEEDGK